MGRKLNWQLLGILAGVAVFWIVIFTWVIPDRPFPPTESDDPHFPLRPFGDTDDYVGFTVDEDGEIMVHSTQESFLVFEEPEYEIIATQDQDGNFEILRPDLIWIILDGKKINLAEWMRKVAVYECFSDDDSLTYGLTLGRTDGMTFEQVRERCGKEND
jgi:hypothetical protein